MARAATVAAGELGRLLRADNGLPLSIGQVAISAGITLPVLQDSQIFDRFLSPEIADKVGGTRYPAIYIFCERITNSLKEKFRTFSGSADLSLEVRVSHDHVEQLQFNLQHYVDAVTDVLDRSRGAWTPGVYYTGGYEVTFQPVKKGGKNFLQTAKVNVRIQLSLD